MNPRTLAFMALSTSACGLLGRDESLLPFPTDGASAFQNAEPIEVCLGTARIVSPSSATGATALCALADQPLRSCSNDVDCAGIERCICGQCIVQPCQGASSCQDNQVCRGKRCTRACALDADCETDERCISGGCARRCNTSVDCHYGERCDSLDDVCTVSLCGNGASCGAGSTCRPVAEIADLREPTWLGNEPVAFVELVRNDQHGIYRALAKHPLAWRIEPPTPVFDVPGETIVGAPSIVIRGTTIDLYATVGNPPRIVHAKSSDDGYAFQLQMDPVLVATEPWENGFVGSPTVFDFQGETYLFYEGGVRSGIGLAKITASGAQRIGTNPIITPMLVTDPIFWRSVTEIGAPDVQVVDDVVRLTFTARGIEGFSATTESGALPPDSNDSIGLATTTDLQSYSMFPTGPIFSRVVNLRAYLGEREASIQLLPSGAQMVFVASDASGETITGLMRAVGRGGTN